MKHFSENILKKRDHVKRQKNIEFDLYNLSEILYNELDHIGVIDRLKSIPQLGTINVNHHLFKSRWDFVALQFWIHKKAHDLVNDSLEYSYASKMHSRDFNPILILPPKAPSVEEFIQTFTLAYNIGHCFNTFLSSRAMIYALKNSVNLFNEFTALFIDQRGKNLLKKLVEKDDYLHFHLLNSILVLEQCNQNEIAVQIAKEMIYAYLGINECSKKLQYVFNVYRKVRDLSITTFDLQLDHTPFRIMLANETSLKLFLREYLARYNDNDKATQIVNSLTRLLSAFIYDEENRTIKMHYIAKKIGRKIIKDGCANYYNDLFLNKMSLINKKPSSSISIDSNCLKVTFDENEIPIAMTLQQKLDRMNHVKSAIYYRNNNRLTLVVSVNKNSLSNITLQLRILRIIISSLNKIDDIKSFDNRYLTVAKYFLSHLLKNRIIKINPTGDNNDVCAYCLRGSVNKKNILNNHIKNYSDPGEKHEIEHMINILHNDNRKDFSILIPASIIVLDINGGKSDVEFDGFIIHPYRKIEQIVFLEAKASKIAGKAKKELKIKLDKLNFNVNNNDIIRTGDDAYYSFSIK